VRVEDDGRDEAGGRRDGNANIYIRELAHEGALPGAVDLGHLQQGRIKNNVNIV
jgi:hypothetical protein